jgi:hypothetical protein
VLSVSAPGSDAMAASFLPRALAAWRSQRPKHRSVIMRDGGVLLQEQLHFELHELRFDSLADAEVAVLAGARLEPAQRRTRADRRRSAQG